MQVNQIQYGRKSIEHSLNQHWNTLTWNNKGIDDSNLSPIQIDLELKKFNK